MHSAAPSPARENITGLILAGGQGRRMAYRNKGLEPYQGIPLLEHVLKRLTTQVSGILISANADLEAYGRYAYPVLSDILKGGEPDCAFWGPLAGIHAGLVHCPTPYLAVSPCDTPNLPLDFVQTLALLGPPAYYVEQPLLCLLPTTLTPTLADFLASGERKVQHWWRSVKQAQAHNPSNQTPIKNINATSDLA